jgi:hypothetical protein
MLFVKIYNLESSNQTITKTKHKYFPSENDQSHCVKKKSETNNSFLFLQFILVNSNKKLFTRQLCFLFYINASSKLKVMYFDTESQL